MRGSVRVRATTTVALLLCGCVTSRVHVNEPDARVYVDGRRVAPGQRFWAVGPPHRADVQVVAPDGREARAQVRREFGFGTLVLGFYSFGVCWVVCWTYPSELTVILPPRSASSWDDPAREDPWTRPPHGWSPSVAPAPGKSVRPEPVEGRTDAEPQPAPATNADPWSAPPSK